MQQIRTIVFDCCESPSPSLHKRGINSDGPYDLYCACCDKSYAIVDIEPQDSPFIGP